MLVAEEWLISGMKKRLPVSGGGGLSIYLLQERAVDEDTYPVTGIFGKEPRPYVGEYMGFW